MQDGTDPDAPTSTSPDAARSARRVEQGLIDAEVRASRRAMLARFRAQLRATPPQTLTTDEFLQVADRPTVLTAIIIAAGVLCDACELHTLNPDNRTLRIARHRGLPKTFVEHFASVDVSTASTCATAMRTGQPALVDDVTTSPIYTQQPTRQVMLDTGIRAVHSYPLHADDLLSVLCLHHRTTGPHPSQHHLADAAAQALAHVPARSTPTYPAFYRPPHSQITTKRVTDDVVTIAVQGPLDALTAPDCTARVHETITSLTEGQVLIIDLREMGFLAAAGARALAVAMELCASRGVHGYVLVTPDRAAVQVLDVLGFTPRLRPITDAAPILAGRLP